MSNFELKLRQDTTILTKLGNLNRELPNLPPGFVIQLTVRHQIRNPVMRCTFFHASDPVFLTYQGIQYFWSCILAVEGIGVEDDGRFSSPNRLQLLPANASMAQQSEPIYTLRHLAEHIFNYAWQIRHNFYGRSVKFVEIAMDLTVSHQQSQFATLDETVILDGRDYLAVIKPNMMAPPAVRLVDEIIQASFTAEDCSICLERLAVGQFASRMPCAHVFHKQCIAPWVEKSRSCPLCRADLSIHG